MISRTMQTFTWGELACLSLLTRLSGLESTLCSRASSPCFSTQNSTDVGILILICSTHTDANIALVTLGFATVSGVRLGLGYNSAVRTPKLEEITQFPFVNDHAVAGTGNDPMKILKAMVQGNAGGQAWVTPT